MGTRTRLARYALRIGMGCAILMGWIIGQVIGVPNPVAWAVEGGGKESIVAPQADQLLRDMAAYLGVEDAFSFHAEITYDDPLPSGQKLQYGAEMDVAVHRPNRLYAEYTGDLGGKRFWYDGKTLTLLDTTELVYSTVAAPATIEEALNFAIERYDLSVPLAGLLYPDVYQTLRENVRYGFQVGMATVDGVRCHHLAFVERYVEWQIWIEDGMQTVPRKIVITYKTQPGSPQYTAWLSDWTFGLHLPHRLFVAEVPVGAERIEFVEAPKTRSND